MGQRIRLEAAGHKMGLFRSRRKLNQVLQRNKFLILAFFCSCAYCLVLSRVLYQQSLINSNLSPPQQLAGLTEVLPKPSAKSELPEATFLPMLDPFNPFVLQKFSWNLGELSCRGEVYGRLRKRRLFLSAGNFQELSYSVIEGNETKNKVYIVGETADRNGISLGFQGIIQHISGKCVHPNKPFIKEGVGLVFYEGCEDLNRLVYVFDKTGRWRNSDRNMCVQPTGGLLIPPNRTPLEFSKSCGEASLFRPLSNGAIQHVHSGMCVHPNYGSARPEDDELLVLYDGCHFQKIKFSWLNAISIENVITRSTQHRVNHEVVKLGILRASDSIQHIKTEYHVQVVEKLHLLKRYVVTENPDQFDILVIMFNSMSSANFQRTMPRIYGFLRRDPETVVFPGFSLLGEGDFTQTEVFLTGRSGDRREGRSGEGSRWLFERFQDAGYVTMAIEDQMTSREFRMMMEKFGGSSVDHSPNGLWEEVNRNGNTGETTLCIGSQFPFNISMSYLKSFLESYRNHPKFAFMMNAGLTSWNLNTAGYAQGPLLEFLKKKKRKPLKNTVIVIFGDHGWKGRGLRETSQGKLEERLPFLSVTMPRAFRERYPDKFQDMVLNSRSLVTPFDVHATLSELSRLSESAGGNVTENTTRFQGQSLFTKWEPNSRNCTSLGIPEHWCPCVSLREVNVSEGNLEKISEVIVENLNHILKNVPAEKCRKLYLKNVVSVKLLRILSKVRHYRTSHDTEDCRNCKAVFWNALPKTKDFIYQVDIRVQPGERVYRTMINLIEKELYVGVRPRLISGTARGNCTKDMDSFIGDYCECSETLY